MAADRPVKRSKPHPPPPPRPHKHAPNAYVARIISLEELWHVVQGGVGPDAAVTWVAERQLALITTPQLHVAGVRRGSIEWRLASGTLHPRHRGVYLVGHGIPVPGAIELAAVLACGERAFVSHRSAVGLWGLVASPGVGVDLTVVRRRCRSRDGLRVHRVDTLDAADRAHRRGIPVTSPARTIVDYAATASATELEHALTESYAKNLTDERRVLAATERVPTHAGVALLRSILGQPGGPQRTRSGGERAMLKLIRAAGLPAPRTNLLIAGFNADFVWQEERLIVEVDGYPFHGHRAAFERDHRRDIVHKNAGYEVLRFTARQLDEEPLLVVAAIVRALDRRARG